MSDEILIVDDALFMRRIIKAALNEIGFENLLEAKDGEEAISIFKKKKPRIVLLDITMPGKSGMDVLKEIMEIDSGAIVIMCSAMGQDEIVKKATRQGASDYIRKPFKKEELAATINKFI